LRANLIQFLAALTLFAAIAILLLLLGACEASAQVTGKVIGHVTDRDTGQPLVGGQVVVEGTNLGNVSNEDGYYFINNVPVGVQRITAQYLGYQTTSSDQRILAGQTTTVDFAMASEVIQAEGMVATIEIEPLVARDNTVSKTRFTPEDVQNLPVGGIASLIELAAGVYQGTTGLIVRGGRGTESATYVDGALVTDFTTQQRNTQIARFGVEEVDVITGGFGAEFGHAQSGVANIVTREGGQAYHGNLRFTTDGQFGTNGYSAEELEEAGETLSIEPQKCCGFNQLQASLGGPVAGEKLTFFASAELTGAADRDPRSGGFNPAMLEFNSEGSTETILPGNRGDSTRLQGKLTSFITGTSKITGTYLFSREQDEIFLHGRGGGLFQFFNAGTRVKAQDAIVGYDQQIYQTAERSLNVQVRANWHETDLAGGVPVSPEMTAVLRAAAMDPTAPQFAQLLTICGSACEAETDTFDDDFLNWRFDDIEFYFEDNFYPGGNLEQGIPIVIPPARSTDPDPTFGVTQMWRSGGMSSGLILREENRLGIRVDLDAQLNRVHRAKAGFEWTNIKIDNIDGAFESAQNSNVFFAEPRVAAAYVQDRLDYVDLVIDLGLRVDRFDPNAMFPALPGIVPCEISNFTLCQEDAESVEAETKTEWSPRLGVAHPITDATQVRLSYGKFHQLPELRHFYSSVGTDFEAAQNNPNILYGNPNLDYVETTAFEAGITHLISEDLVLDVVGYNRDRRGAIRLDVFQPGQVGPDERRIYTNGDNGNVKGVDITLSKRYSNYFASDLAWSLQWARGTTSSPTEWATGSGFGRLFDPLTPGVLLPPPSELQPESFDRLHNINWSFTLRFPDDYKEGTTAGILLQDFGVFVVYNAHSGEPWTRRSVTGQGEPLEDIGGSRLPWVHSGDLRVTKGIDILGDFGFEVFATVENFLDVENVVRVNAGSGEPDITGFEDQLSVTPNIPVIYRTDGSGPGDFPVAVTSLTEDFRDRFARNDLNGDGIITLAEAQENLLNALVASGSGADFTIGDVGDSPYNYGTPRLFRFGVEVRF
jgi:hypothetical protein